MYHRRADYIITRTKPHVPPKFEKAFRNLLIGLNTDKDWEVISYYKIVQSKPVLKWLEQLLVKYGKNLLILKKWQAKIDQIRVYDYPKEYGN